MRHATREGKRPSFWTYLKVIQVNKAIRYMEPPGRQMNLNTKEEEELALRQLISGITPEWQEVKEKDKRATNTIMKLWTGKMMNWARIQMKMWTGKKDEHKVKVQRRWDNTCIMSKVFTRWKFMTGLKIKDSKEGREGNKEPEERK
eukprot:1305090-Pleurochrysis_carterae.AAC.1